VSPGFSRQSGGIRAEVIAPGTGLDVVVDEAFGAAQIRAGLPYVHVAVPYRLFECLRQPWNDLALL